jgi:two-component system chemotaxis family response regulator WspR
MPQVNGLDLVRQYRADPVTKGIPIIVLSTKEEARVKSDAFVAGPTTIWSSCPTGSS